MNFQIKCSTFLRFASICGFFEPTTPQELRDQLKTVRLEKVKGKTIAIATNQKIAAMELLHDDGTGESGVAHVILDPALINQCKGEAFLDGVLIIDTIPEIATGMARTSSGWSYQGNACHFFEETIMDDWREWASKPVGKSAYIMSWNLAHVQALFEASPSGKIYFPRYIDATKSIAIRDINNPWWVGLFIPSVDSDKRTEEAQIPDWWNMK